VRNASNAVTQRDLIIISNTPMNVRRLRTRYLFVTLDTEWTTYSAVQRRYYYGHRSDLIIYRGNIVLCRVVPKRT